MTPSPRARLAELLIAHSLRHGEFTLASGEITDVYLDVKSTSLLGEGAYLIGSLLWELVEALDRPPQAIGGLTLGADPLVTAVSLAAFHAGKDLAAMIVRKESKSHGTARFLEFPPTLSPGARLVAVDDVITTGGSTLKAIRRMRQGGFIVEDAICVVDRRAGGEAALAAEGVRLFSLYRLDELQKG